jgi:hypothetical protein
MQEKLYEATRSYNRSLRWSDYDRAAAWVPATSEFEFMNQHEDLDDEFVMLDYQLTRLNIDKDNGIAHSRVELQWHMDRTLVVETTAVDQTWQWHGGRWWLVEEWRASGEPMPMFAEKPSAGTAAHPYLPGLEQFRETFAIGEDDERKGAAKRSAARAKDPGSAPGARSIPTGIQLSEG